jgi:hypothetical protein
MKYEMPGLYLALVLALFSSSATWAGGISDWIDNNLIDPQDGKLDASDYLASAKGFLPVPIIITEPAVGFGLGLAIAYFHPPVKLDPDQHSHNGPPSISVGLGAKTENGTYLYGGAHLGSWKKDHVRYTGALAKVNANLTVYNDNREDGLIFDDGIPFNIDGDFLFQQVQFRLKESNWWLGTNYMYVTAANTFDLGGVLPPEFPNPQFDFDLAGLGVYVHYDGRDSVFTPTKGVSAKLEYQSHNDTWGSDFDFDRVKASVFHYTPVGEYSSLGLRLAGETVDGDTPFFAYPFVSLRGIPALRYQGESVYAAEAEYLWGFTPRWSLAVFGGVGKTTDIDGFGGKEGQTVAAGGVGFRYRLARKFGLQAGLDIARGPEDTSVYLTIGSAWSY